MELGEATSVFETLRQTFSRVAEGSAGQELTACTELLAKLKKTVSVYSICNEPNKLLLARETLEIGALTSILTHDVPAFERYVTQLKTYYVDYQTFLPKSTRTQAVQGLYLLHLLSVDRIGEFHTELEVIPVADHEAEHIRTAIEFERHMMDGNYAILTQNVKRPQYFSFFMDQLMETVRSKVATAMEKSYSEFSAKEAAKMLMLSSVADLAEFAKHENERKAQREAAAAEDETVAVKAALDWKNEGAELSSLPTEVRWEVAGDTLKFNKPAVVAAKVPSLDLISNAVGYATNLERIV
jgi:26S proteasome regulatory subunit N12